MKRQPVRKTKIVCTLGPASSTREVLKRLILAGMDVARLNFSHGSHDDHRRTIDLVRELSSETGRRVAFLQDLCGPKIRVGDIPGGPVTLVKDELFVITSEERPGDVKGAHISYEHLAEEVAPGTRILLDDGLLELVAVDVKPPAITCRVVTGGPLSSHKGVNFPELALRTPAFTEKDREDLLFGIAQGVDWVAMSFVRRPADVLEVKEFMRSRRAFIPVVAKIEKAEAIRHLEEIVEVSDALMVARGDLGVETTFESLPLLQKQMIALSRNHGKPVITATQMLDSMIRNPRPTRAEVTDVANAIFDGTDAVMLSGESASGAYPVEAVEVMARIAVATEQALPYNDIVTAQCAGAGTLDVISLAACEMAQELDAAAIVVATSSGRSARAVARYRPEAPVVALTESEEAARRLNLSWGVFPIVMEARESTDTFIEEATRAALTSPLLREGDLVILSASYPAGLRGSTNTLQVQVLGRTYLRGRGIGAGSVEGKLLLVHSPAECASLEGGTILGVRSLTEEYGSVLSCVTGLVVEDENVTEAQAALLAELGLPTLIGVAALFTALEGGEHVSIDAPRGILHL